MNELGVVLALQVCRGTPHDFVAMFESRILMGRACLYVAYVADLSLWVLFDHNLATAVYGPCLTSFNV